MADRLLCPVLIACISGLCVAASYGEPSSYRNYLDRDVETVYYPGGPRSSYSRPKTYQTYDRRADIEPSEKSYSPLGRDFRSALKKASLYRRYKDEPAYGEAYPEVEPERGYAQPESPRRYETPEGSSYAYKSRRYGSPRRRKEYYDEETSSRTYGAPRPKFTTPSFGAKRTYTRSKDPCVHKYDGQYVLGKEFRRLFPYVDSMCYFTKCANKKAFLNPCSPGTRNDKYGQGFCSYLDLEGYCGEGIYGNHSKDNEDSKEYNRGKTYKEYSYGSYH